MPSKEPLEIEITQVFVDDLKPNPWNSNVVSPENEARIEASIRRYGGLFKPILARQSKDEERLEILGGEHRWRVAKKMGMTHVPVINLGKLSDKKAKEIGLVDNGRYGEDDALKLAEILDSIGPIDDLQTFLPMIDEDLAAVFSSTTIPLDTLDIPSDEPTDQPKSETTEKPVQTHQMMRFKVPIEDAHRITEVVERVMKEQEFTKEDSLTNAGNALVHIFGRIDK